MSTKSKIAALLLGLLISAPAFAQQAVVRTEPYPVTTKGSNVSTTIASTNTFQKVFSAFATGGTGVGGTYRRGCTIQNNSTHNMFVSEGLTISTSTLTNTVILAANSSYYCNIGNNVLVGEIDITGTSGDAFYAAQY